MSAIEGKAVIIGAKADIQFSMSAVGGRPDVVCQELSGPLIAITGNHGYWIVKFIPRLRSVICS
jgi:predicted phosphohydrolase